MGRYRNEMTVEGRVVEVKEEQMKKKDGTAVLDKNGNKINVTRFTLAHDNFVQPKDAKQAVGKDGKPVFDKKGNPVMEKATSFFHCEMTNVEPRFGKNDILELKGSMEVNYDADRDQEFFKLNVFPTSIKLKNGLSFVPDTGEIVTEKGGRFVGKNAVNFSGRVMSYNGGEGKNGPFIQLTVQTDQPYQKDGVWVSDKTNMRVTRFGADAAKLLDQLKALPTVDCTQKDGTTKKSQPGFGMEVEIFGSVTQQPMMKKNEASGKVEQVFVDGKDGKVPATVMVLNANTPIKKMSKNLYNDKKNEKQKAKDAAKRSRNG